MRIDDLLSVAAALEREGVQYALFGPMAMAVHGVDRATRDLDVFVAADADNIDRLRRALHAVFDDPEIDQITSQDLAGDYPAIQYAARRAWTSRSTWSAGSAMPTPSTISRSRSSMSLGRP